MGSIGEKNPQSVQLYIEHKCISLKFIMTDYQPILKKVVSSYIMRATYVFVVYHKQDQVLLI